MTNRSLKEILELLKRLQFSNFDHEVSQYLCPECDEYFLKYGHKKECELNNKTKDLIAYFNVVI